MESQQNREKALCIWEEQIRLLPSEVQLQCALWNCQDEMREVMEELCDYLRASRRYPNMPKQQVFFEEK